MFGKNLKKFFGTVLSAAMVVSAIPVFTIGAYADETKTSTSAIEYLSESKILLYNDYENYTGGAFGYLENQSIGDFHLGFSGGLTNNARKTEGINGVGVDTLGTSVTNIEGAWNAKLTNPIKDGKLYIAFDIERASDEYIENTMQKNSNGTENETASTQLRREMYVSLNGEQYNTAEGTQRPLRAYIMRNELTHSENTTKYAPGLYAGGKAWNSWDPEHKLSDMKENTTYKVEMVTDVKTRTVSYYVDGSKSEYSLTINTPSQNNGTNAADSSVEWGVYSIGFSFPNTVNYFDNLTIAYIDDDSTTAETFSIASENVLFTGGNTLKIKALADITDSATEPNRAPYGVSLSGDTLKPENFTVKKGEDTVAVKSVTKGEKTGEYVIETEENLTGGTYTVTVSDEVTDVTGCLTLNSEANTATVKANDKVIYSETFDEGTSTVNSDNGYDKVTETDDGGNTKQITKTLGNVTYNVKKTLNDSDELLIMDGEFSTAEDKDNVEVNGNKGLSIKNNSAGAVTFALKLGESMTSGVISYSYDTATLTRNIENNTSNNTVHTMINKTSSTEGKGSNKGGWYVFEMCRVKDRDENVDNGDGTTKIVTYYKENVRRAVAQSDGLGDWAVFATNNTGDYKDLTTDMHNVQQIFDMDAKLCYTYIDGVALGDPRNIKSFATSGVQDISIGLSKWDYYFDNLNFRYMSSNGEKFKVSADELLDNGATEMTINFEDPVQKDVIKAENFVVKNANDEAVTVTDATWVSPYEAKITFAALDAGNYTVSTQNITTAVGAESEDTEMSFRVKTDGLYIESVSEEKGTYTVNITNDTETEKGAVLVAGVFVGGKLIECVTDDTFGESTTLDGGANENLSVTLTRANDTGATVKVFLWDSLANAKPLAEQLR